MWFLSVAAILDVSEAPLSSLVNLPMGLIFIFRKKINSNGLKSGFKAAQTNSIVAEDGAPVTRDDPPHESHVSFFSFNQMC